MIIRTSNFLQYMPPVRAAVLQNTASPSTPNAGDSSGSAGAGFGGTDLGYRMVDSAPPLAPRLVVAPRSIKIVRPEAVNSLSQVTGALGPVYLGSLGSPLLNPVMKHQFEEEFKKAYPALGEGYEIVGVGIAAWGCYEKFRGPHAAGVVSRTFCAVDVVLGVIGLLGYVIPAIQNWSKTLTIVHLVWSSGDSIHEMVVKGSDPAVRPLLGHLSLGPETVRAAGMSA